MKLNLHNSIISATLLALTANSHAAVIAGGNGSFETNTFTNPGIYGINNLWETTAGSVSGWTLSGTGRWFMKDDAARSGAPQDGNSYVNLSLGELGGYGFSMSTAITGLTIGNNYAVEFYASERDGITAGTSFSASVDTTVPATLTVTEASLPTVVSGLSNYVKQTLTFTATATSHTFTLSNTGTGATGNGFLVDNVSVIPEPSAALIGGLGMLALLRRRR